ncbi:MAG: hypothetical protein COA58_09900 [Bacteroidetes bacterium]|nr:MAG: hypothetical protein COA58_09900 [Bacteroidota bacterium]
MKNVYILVCLLFCYTAKSQVIINPHPVSGFQISSNDILNFDVINSVIGANESGVVAKFRIQVKSDEVGGRTILEMMTSNHHLKPGVTNFNMSNVNVISKKFLSPEIANYESKANSFPTGSYVYCISVICQDKVEQCEKHFIQEQPSTQCGEFTIRPITPLLLSLPIDEDVLKIKRPNFNWIPPMPLGNDPDISYEMTLVHLNKDQRGEDGIRRNRPIFQRDGIRAINLIFPTTLEDLEAGEHYAWQVKAHLGNILAGTSEVWEFEIEKEVEPPRYVRLKQNEDAAILEYTSQSSIFFIYESRYSNSSFTLTVKNSESKVSVQDLSIDEDLRETSMLYNEGNNKYVINLSSLGLEPDLYFLELQNSLGETYKMKFRIIE